MQVSATTPKLVITSANTFWHSKEAMEANSALAELAEMKEEQGDQVEIGAAVFREGLKNKALRFGKKLWKPALSVAAAVGTMAAIAATGGLATIPAALGLTSAISVGIPAMMAGRSMMSDLQAPETGFKRGVNVIQTQDYPINREGLDSDGGPSEVIREVVIANMKQFPSSRHIAHFNGHGFGNKANAGMPGDKAREELTKAVRETGKRFEVAVYETCYGANYEFLHGQAEVADYAVAFEDEAPKTNAKLARIPLGEMLELGLEVEEPRALADKMVQKAAEHFDNGKEIEISNVPHKERSLKKNRDALWRNHDSTVSAFDLQELRGTLSPQLDGLGKQLSEKLKTDNGFKEAVRAARENNAVEKSRDLVDMGGFLSELKDELPDSELKKSLGATVETLKTVTVQQRTSAGQPLSGLSFHTRPGRVSSSNPASDAHADPSLPQGWVDFVGAAFSENPLAAFFS